MKVFHGWWVVLVAVTAMFGATLTGGSGLSIFVLPISTEMGWDRKTIAGALTLGTILGALLAPACGWLVDRYGARVMLTLTGVGLAATLLPIAWMQTVAAFYIFYSAARLIDMAILNTAATTAAANWFIRRRGRVLGITVAGNAIGVAIQTPLAQWMMGEWGWRVAWAVLAVLAAGLLTPLAWWLVRRRPEDMGLLPDGAAPSGGSVQGERVSREVNEEVNWSARDALRTSAYWLLVVSGAVSGMCVAGLSLHQVAILAENGIAAGSAAWIVSLYAFWWAAGCILWGIAAERVSARVALAVMYLVGGLCMIWLTRIDAILPALIYAVIYGLMNGGKETMDAVVWADYYGRLSLGTIRGLSRPVIIGANALGGLIAGTAYDLLDSYGTVIVLFGVLSIGSSGLVLLVRRPRAGPVMLSPER